MEEKISFYLPQSIDRKFARKIAYCLPLDFNINRRIAQKSDEGLVFDVAT